MAFRNRILPHHEKEANSLIHLLNHTIKKQIVALHMKDREEYMKWLAEGTAARKQLLELFRRKTEYDCLIGVRKNIKINPPTKQKNKL
ncbi:hypothetical protein [Bacillus gaemokensis]|uniref:Uncharacterized protein n=1 Tax=Bacillus gaemokensis TaxID=574375 RepID=A0A073KDX6_9BACI|nr:hypothetical protein [Bacillus gaemokensis]KEK24731.1 hypothetical protein BAGA_24030 [Bacillus gaemokensis]KYG34553.1 hypothetical protein AZF08_09150 [Bacillus gaemokensis]